MTRETIATPYGPFPSTYQHAFLADVCVDDGGVQTGPFGSQLHQRDYVPTGTPIITVKHIGDNRIIHQDLSRVSEDDRKRLSRYALQHGDIVFSRVGSVDLRALVREEETGWLFSGSILRVRSKKDLIDPGYLSWFFGLPSFRAYVRRIAFGATRPSLNTKLLSDLPIYFPSIVEQRAIAHVLGTLDDKIELNHRTNETLEAIAQALFKSWFVDFEPVRTKAEGRDLGLPKHIADLFPDHFEDSEVGEIPATWEVVQLPEIIQVNPSRALRRGEMAPYLDMANMPTASARARKVAKRAFGSGMRFADGDTLVARITPCLENGKTCFVDFVGRDRVGWGSTEYIVLRPKPPLPLEYAYFMARTDEFRGFAVSNMTGTSGRQRVPAESLAQFAMVLPDARIARLFGYFAYNIIEEMKAHDEESRTLESIRDTFLPKLMYGDMRIPISITRRCSLEET